MNALGISYLVLAGVAAVLACVHVAQAIVIRSDRTQAVIALMCTGFAVLDLGIAFSSGLTGSTQPTWPGWHILAAAAAAGLTVVVPLVACMVLDVAFSAARLALLVGAGAVGLTRLVGASVLLHSNTNLSWEQLHSLDHAWVAVPSVACPLIGAGVWLIEGALARRRGVRYATSMMIFGVVGTLVSLQGVGVTMGILPPPDLFGLITLPVVAFVQVLSSVRFVHALQTASLPAGDLARYEVLSQLGSGGMGDVFLARRKGPAGFLREVVLKTLHADEDPASKARFVAEARVAAQLRHPNIVDVYDLGEHPGGFFIVMEHIAGRTLAELLRRSVELAHPLPIDVVAEVGTQVCRALSFAHATQVVHRDIKPQNVMVSFAGVLKLIDFGIAQEHVPSPGHSPPARDPASRAQGEGLTGVGRVIGTLGYIAPERYAGEQATVASDLFAVGVLLYELLAQRSPFPAAGEQAFVDAVAARGAPSLDSIRGDVPRALALAIAQCLEPSQADRPVSAASLQARFEDVLRGCHVDLGAWTHGLFPRGDEPRPRPRIDARPAEATRRTPASERPTAPRRGPPHA